MKFFNVFAMTTILTATSFSNADTDNFISIPASAFSPQGSEKSSADNRYKGNDSGTSRDFRRRLFAPVHLPSRAVVTSMTCGSKSNSGFMTNFTLRRNEPQQANIDMAVVETPVEEGQFGVGLRTYQFLSTNAIVSASIDNSIFNYYIVASLVHPRPNASGPLTFSCPDMCANVNFCRIGYSIPGRDPNDNAGKIVTPEDSGSVID